MISALGRLFFAAGLMRFGVFLNFMHFLFEGFLPGFLLSGQAFFGLFHRFTFLGYR